MNPSVAIIGMACIYPDAVNPGELWENALAQRRAFRRLPSERFRREDYWAADPAAPDHTYIAEGAVIEGYEFDRVAFRVVGNTFRSADLAHWLALDVADRALADAGFSEGQGLPRESTGVLLGNTLTGEFSRANAMRLRWPYVRRVLDAALTKEDWSAEQRRAFLAQLEADYKSPFPPVGEETLAGSLSNTIAGRICGHFDLKGGGYTVDGACASSLVAVANACSALMAGDLDVVLAGGVDLSLDPFEIVGFAKTGALAADEMRVFDRRSAGFWPGEGCGMAVLMRHEDALAQGRRVYAVIRGWGISSDGSGAITRPESAGQIEALRRAYRRAGFGIDTVGYCEGHGTGTVVGDATELGTLSRARREARPDAPAATIGSIKANIGHIKAAAGIAGLIKATMVVHTQVVPPTSGCEAPHEQFSGLTPALRVAREAELWPQERPLRASVSAMGFGGINAHVVLEGASADRRSSLTARERSLSRSSQDGELCLFAGESREQLLEQVGGLLPIAERLSRAELTDLAAQLQRTLGTGAVRAAIVASKPAEMAERLQMLESRLQDGATSLLEFSQGVFLGSSKALPRIAFLFPGQGSPTHLDGGIWRRRFESVGELYGRAGLQSGSDPTSTRVMQPAVVTASLAGLTVLQQFGLCASAAIGHSLGEFTALHWAGVFDEDTLLRIARVRGAAMADLGSPTGAMLAVAAPWHQVQGLLTGESLSVVGLNSPRQTVVAGDAEAVRSFARRVSVKGWQATVLPVSHAFHTPLVAAAVPVLAEQLARESLAALRGSVISTVNGALLHEGEDLRALLCRQVTSPVRFESALAALLKGSNASEERAEPSSPGIAQEMVLESLPSHAIDLLIEVGPGVILSGLVRDAVDVPVVSLDAGGCSLKGLLQTLGAAFVLGAPVRHGALFNDRFTRPFALDWKPTFFINPCELAPLPGSGGESIADGEVEFDARNGRPESLVAPDTSSQATQLETQVGKEGSEEEVTSPIELIRQLVAEGAELPVAAIHDDHRMSHDLHLNSITVGRVVSAAAKRLYLPNVVGLTDFANASVAEIACALEELKRAGGTVKVDERKRHPDGVVTWVRAFAVELMELKRTSHGAVAEDKGTPGAWQMFAPQGHPLAGLLDGALARFGNSGVMVCLPENPSEAHLSLLLEGARAAVALNNHPRFIVVQHGWGGGGFARAFHLETPGAVTCVLNVPPACPEAIEWIRSEVRVATGFSEVHFDAEGRRFEPRLKLAAFSDEAANLGSSLSSEDVLLVTGGGKGIAAECALALGRETGVRLALLGRSDPAEDQELAGNLARIAGGGVGFCYLRADVTDAQAVSKAVAEAEQKLGRITAVLHGAGLNTPQLISALDETVFRRTVAPKIQGARNVLAAVDADHLRFFVTFSSIIARTGLAGEADYATANEWLSVLTEDFQRQHPRCRCVALEWSVWSGVGMGERLGRLDMLIQQGITPITVDQGVRTFCDLVRHSRASGSLVVTGRFGEPPTLKLAEVELPLQRFLERKMVYYPGVELVVDAELSVGADPYLLDHVLQQQPMFPAVLGLEAMAQAAMALAGSAEKPIFENVEFLRPVGVSEQRPSTIRLAALQRSPGCVEVCLRSEETDFQVDHFRTLCKFGQVKESRAPQLALSSCGTQEISLDPQTDLYGRILFHLGRFCRLSGYRLLKAKECVADITGDDSGSWFGPYLPSELVLGDPGARDAALHAVQACIPHRRILPTGIERLVVGGSCPGARVVRAKQRLRDGSDFLYDMEVTDSSGEVVERWEGLRLRAVELMTSSDPWPEPLLGPYLERRLEEIVPGSAVGVAFGSNGKKDRSTSSDSLIQHALGQVSSLWRRPDGKPMVFGADCVSVAHARDFTLAVTGTGGVACDMEDLRACPTTVWNDLLGEQAFKLAGRISRERREEVNSSALRLWSTLECVKKAGLPQESPLVVESAMPDGWVLLRAGALYVATCVTAVRGLGHDLVIALALVAASRRPAGVATGAVG